MHFLFLIPVVFYMPFGNDPLRPFLSFIYDLTLIDIARSINSKAGNRIASHYERLFTSFVARNSFLNDMPEKTCLANAIILQNKIS